METNTLVRHKKIKSLGIGCVSKIFSKQVNVNFGQDDTVKCKIDILELIDVSKCKTITLKEWQSKSITNSFKNGEGIVIVGNEVKEYVGIGWISLRVVTEADLSKYPRLIN